MYVYVLLIGYGEVRLVLVLAKKSKAGSLLSRRFHKYGFALEGPKINHPTTSAKKLLGVISQHFTCLLLKLFKNPASLHCISIYRLIQIRFFSCKLILSPPYPFHSPKERLVRQSSLFGGTEAGADIACIY